MAVSPGFARNLGGSIKDKQDKQTTRHFSFCTRTTTRQIITHLFNTRTVCLVQAARRLPWALSRTAHHLAAQHSAHYQPSPAAPLLDRHTRRCQIDRFWSCRAIDRRTDGPGATRALHVRPIAAAYPSSSPAPCAVSVACCCCLHHRTRVLTSTTGLHAPDPLAITAIGCLRGQSPVPVQYQSEKGCLRRALWSQ